MAVYSFKNLETNEIFEVTMPMSERDKFLEDNKGKYVQVITSAPSIGDSVRLGIRRIENGFNETLQKVKASHLHSTVNTK